MRYLVKNVLILDEKSPFYKKKVDFSVSEGKILEVSSSLKAKASDIVIQGSKLILSPGFVDIYTTSGESSRIEAESLDSLLSAGTRGGFSHIAHQPSLDFPTEDKSSVVYLASANHNSISQIIPIGSIIRAKDNKILANMQEMRQAGAAAFSSGELTLELDTLSNALQYAKGFSATLLLHPEKQSLSKQGQVHQGVQSIRMGFRGIPEEAETIAVEEIIKIAEYTDAEIVLMNLSTRTGLQIVKKAIKKGVKIKTAVSIQNLFFDEEAVSDYDTSLKLNPPLRPQKDVLALRTAVLDGDIDIVYSQHTPCTTEEKNLEFDLAKRGASSIQTALLACIEALGKEHIERCISVLSVNPANLLSLKQLPFQKNAVGSFTLIDLQKKYLFSDTENKSKSKNSPYLGKEFSSSIIGLISNHSETFFN